MTAETTAPHRADLLTWAEIHDAASAALAAAAQARIFTLQAREKSRTASDKMLERTFDHVASDLLKLKNILRDAVFSARAEIEAIQEAK